MMAMKALILWGFFASQSLALPATIPQSGTESASSLTPRRQLSKRIPVADNTWFVCGQPGDAQGQVSYFSTDVQFAVITGYQAVQNDVEIEGSNGRQYPGTFYNNNFWNINQAIAASNDPVNTLAEFPLVEGGFEFGDDPGPDRVVFDTITGDFMGVMTHRGLPNNRFRPALQHNSPPIILPLAPPLADFLAARPPPWEFGLPNYGGNYKIKMVV